MSSTVDFKKAWEEALLRAILASHAESELADTALAMAAGLPVRSGLRAGAGLPTAYGVCYGGGGGGGGPTAGCTTVEIIPWRNEIVPYTGMNCINHQP